jgi:hypothetical protein
MISATDISLGFLAGDPAAGVACSIGSAGFAGFPPADPDARAAAMISATLISLGFLPVGGGCFGGDSSGGADFASAGAADSGADSTPPLPSVLRQAAMISSTDMPSFLLAMTGTQLAKTKPLMKTTNH